MKPDLDTTTLVDTIGTDDDDLGVDVAVEDMVRGRLTALADRAVVPDDAWEKLTARTTAEGTRRGGVLRGRRRLVAAAAILLALVGSTVADSRGDDGRVQTDDTPTTTVDADDRDRDDRGPDDRDEVPVEPDREDVPGAPDAGDESAAPRPSRPMPAPGSGGRGGSGGSRGGAPAPTSPAQGGTTLPAPTTTAPTTTTTTPPSPSRLPGDVTVNTSSGFDVELVLEEVAHRISAVVRRTDSRYDGSQGTRYTISDGYEFTTGVVVVAQSIPTLGPRCVSWNRATVDPHLFAFGLVGSDVASVDVLLEGGGTVPGVMTARSVSNGVRAFMVEAPGGVAGVVAYDAAGGLVVSAAWPDTHRCDGSGPPASG